jgi:prepilin-type N-terminal cleavage/methylation domain-containing protein
VPTWAERLRRRALAHGEDSGFTLVEILVGLILFALVAQGLAAVLISSANSSLFTRMSTTAKNLAQQRIDAMRSLPFHVDAQNGPYVDLLDLYYHDASGTPDAIPDVVPGSTVPGDFVGLGGSGGPSGPYYRLTIAGSQLGAAYAKYTQYVYTQFLVASNPAASPLPLSAIPGGYDNSAAGADHPASPLIGVTTVVTWTTAGRSHSYSTFTEITDQGTNTSLVVSQAKAVVLQVLSQDYLGNAITANVASVAANGSLSNGSQAGAEATGASIVDGSSPAMTGAHFASVAPPNPSGSQGVASSSGQQQVGASGSCGWASFGPTAVSDVSATTASGLPIVPSDANTTALSPSVSASLYSSSGGSCAGLWLSNQIDGSPAPDPALQLNSSAAMIKVQDQTGGSAEVTGTGSVYTSAQPGAAGAVTARTSASMQTWVKVFPGLSFVPAPPAAYGITGQPGIVNVSLSQATLACSSTPGGGTTATLTYSGLIAWYTTAGWQQRSFNWSSASGGSDPLQVVDLSKPVNAAGTPLSAYITSVSGATSITGGAGGVQSVEAAISVSTVPTLGLSYPGTTLGVELGHLSCVAQDNRA